MEQVWATGNTARPITKALMNDLGEAHKGKRGLIVDEYMRVQGADGIWALGDCTQTPCKVSRLFVSGISA